MGPNDYGKVQIKVDGTTDWVDISPSYINTGSDVWTYPSIDLSDYAGQSVQIAFYIYSNPFDVSTGWYIDDVEVLTGPMTFNNPEDWESGLGEWASESGTWEVGTPSGGPGEAYEGQQCAATVLNGNYATSVSSRLTSPTYAIPSASKNPRLRFWHWYTMGPNDYGKVQIKIDGTVDWIDIPSAYYTNTSGNIWTYTYFDLSNYAGQSVQFAFYIYSNAFDVSTGWYIDDVIIEFDSQLSTETNFLTYSFGMPPQTGDATIDATAHTVDIEVEYGTVLTYLISTFTLSDGATAKIGGVAQVSGTTVNDFSSPVTYTITAEDGITVQDWEVTVTVAPNAETEITDFGFGIPPQTGDATIDAVNHTIDIEVEYGTDVTNLVSTFTLSDGASAEVGAVAQVSGTTENDFSSPVTYAVTAEDGTTVQDWMVTVTVAPNTEIEILEFGYGIPPQTGTASIDEVNHTVDIEVESGTDVTGLVATFALSDGATAEIGGVAQTSGTTPNDFSSPVTYTITAEDGITTQEWVIRVTEEVVLNNETHILTYSFGIPPQTGEASIDEVNHTVDIEVESGTDLTSLVATFTLSEGATAEVGGVAQTSGSTSKDFSSPVTYTITAEDGTTTQDWVVTVTEEVVLNNETDILTYSFGIPPQTGAASIDYVNHAIDIEVESGTNLTNLVTSFTISDGASAKVGGVAQESGTTENDFSSPVTYTVTAEDGTTIQDWLVTITVAPITVIDLGSGLVAHYPFNGNANDETGNGHDGVVNGATLTSDRFGNENSAYHFDGNDYISVADDPSFTFGTNPFSLSLWINLDQIGSYYIMGHDDGGGYTKKWILWFTGNSLGLHERLNGEYWIINIPWDPELNKWYFISLIRNQNTFSIYVDGGLIGSIEDSRTIPDPSEPLLIGNAELSERMFRGDIDDVSIYNRALNVAEIDSLFNQISSPNDNADIVSFGFGTPPQTIDAAINTNSHTINIEVESGTDLTSLVATFTLSNGATAEVGGVAQTSGTTSNDFSSPVTYTITAEDGTSTLDWVVTVKEAPTLSDETDILTYSFGIPPQTGNSIINHNSHTVTIEVENGTDITGLVANFTLSDGATVKIGDDVQTSGLTSNNFTNTVTYSVTAEDGTTVQDWVVKVSVATGLNDESDILTFGFGIPPQTVATTINFNFHTITVEVEYGTDLTNLIAGFSLSEGASAKVGDAVQESGVTVNDFTSPVTYTVTAEDGITVRDWLITVTVAPNIETEILEYGFGMPPQTGVASIDATTHTIDVEVEYGIDLSNLVAEFSLSEGASAKVGDAVQESGVTSNDFTNPVIYSVIAEDGTTVQEWVVTVSVAANTETEILEFGFGIPPQTGASVINPDTWTIQIEVESETDLTNLIATFKLSEGATVKISEVVQESGITPNDFSSLVIYTVIAEDGMTAQEWNVLVDRITGANEFYLKNFKIYPNPFSENTTIEFSNPKHSNYKMVLYNILGKKVLEMNNVTSDKIILKRGSLKSGIYLIELRGEQTYYSKLIVEK